MDKVTIQSGGTLNAALLRLGLVDKLSVVVAPALVGGKDTATLIDGSSLVAASELRHIKALRLQKAETLRDSYLHLFYDVIQQTRIT